MNSELVDAVKQKRALLFVGAGVSASLGIPTFKGLVDQLATQLEYDPEIYASLGDYLALAEYYKLAKGSIGPLRSWMDKSWNNSAINLSESEVHKRIVELEFQTIYTTNYDSWLERAHDLYKRPYTKIVCVGDIAKARPGDVQIIKFHGDFDDDDSIVLTESDYFERLSFESPLDIKLRSDLLGRTTLFIGYSLTDINIRYMLFRLSRLWSNAATDSSRPKSFVFLTRPNLVQEAILKKRGVEAIVSRYDDPREGLITFLRDLAQEALGRS